MVCYLFIERKPIGIPTPSWLSSTKLHIQPKKKKTQIYFFYSTLSKANVLGRFARLLALRIFVHRKDKKNENVCVFHCSKRECQTRQPTRRKSWFFSFALLFLPAFSIFRLVNDNVFCQSLRTFYLGFVTEQWTLNTHTHTRITQTHTPHAHRRRVYVFDIEIFHVEQLDRRCDYGNMDVCCLDSFRITNFSTIHIFRIIFFFLLVYTCVRLELS